MGGKSSPAPAPQPVQPTPQQTAQAQTASNIAAANANAELNNVNTYTPWGALTYAQNGKNADGTLKYTANVTLSDAQQKMLDQQQQGQLALGDQAQSMLGAVKGSMASPLTASSLPGVASRVTNGSNSPWAIRQAQNAAYQAQAQFLDPQYAQREAQLKSELANQGVVPGTAAYDSAMADFNRGRTQDYQAARNSAVSAGQAEQNTLFNQGIQGANLQNTANQQALAQAITLRDQPLNEYNALMSGGQVSMPSFPTSTPNTVAPTDVAGITNQNYQNQLGLYNAQVGQQNSLMNGLFSLGGSGLMAYGMMHSAAPALMASDERVKKNKKRVGTTPVMGLPVYTFEYKKPFEAFGLGGKKQIGVMAQDLEKVNPAAVLRRPDGLRMVDYSQVQ